MGLTGDFAKLTALRARLRGAATPDMMTGIARVVGETARTQLAMGFRQSVDPYGQPWAKLRRRKGKPLLDTGRLRNSFTYSASPSGLRIGTNVVYAPHHQYGTGGRKSASSRFQPVGPSGRFMSRRAAGVKRGKNVQYLWHGFRRLNYAAGGGKIPARMMLPTADRGLGNWRDPMRDAATRFIARQLRGS